MDLGRILTRSFQITFRFRALWVFGILLAIFGGSGGGSGNFGNFNPGGPSSPNQGLPNELPLRIQQLSSNTIALIVGVVVCVVLILFLLSIILRLTSRGALVGLVHELETGEVRPTVRRGFNIGFDRFWSLLGIGLIVNIPIFVVSLILFLLAAIPLIASIIPLIQAGRSPEQFAGPAVAGIFSSIVLFCCVIIVLLIVGLVIQPFYQFFVRACVIGHRGAMDSIREGYRLVRANAGNVILLYIILIGIAIAYSIVVFVLVLILLATIGALGLGVGFLSRAVMPGVIAAVVIGIPAIILLIVISGIYQVFDSTMWTEGYLALTTPPAPARQEPAPPPAAP